MLPRNFKVESLFTRREDVTAVWFVLPFSKVEMREKR
jgi:hypothetical protein